MSLPERPQPDFEDELQIDQPGYQCPGYHYYMGRGWPFEAAATPPVTPPMQQPEEDDEGDQAYTYHEYFAR